jgi:CheY-like chemotaxis protein
MNVKKETPRFLVVDDDDESRDTIVEYLYSLGFPQVVQAKDGQEALKILDKDPAINFIISDWDMPKLNGLTLLQKVRSHPKRHNIPFLIATSPISKEQEKIVLAAENMVSSYIIKPFRIQTFQEKVMNLIEREIKGIKRHAVVVDDDEDARAMVTEYLKSINFNEVKDFKDAKTALSYLESHFSKVGLVVSDWEMPEMTGIELLKVCKTDARLRDIPFLMITSQSSIERMKVMQAARSNVDDYLLKPFNTDDIKKRVNHLLHRASAKAKTTQAIVEALENLEHGRFNRAIQLFEDVLKIDPESDVALRGMGDAIAKAKGVDAAMPYYKKAVESNPHNAKGYVKLAQSYEQVGLLDKAQNLLQSAVSEIGFNADIHYQLGWVYHKQGKNDLARTEFRIALEIQLDHQEARLMLELLGQGKQES